jgi:hypothetical protein
MRLRLSALPALALLLLAVVVVGCGSSSKKASPSTGGGAATPAAEAKATATGDIPDNQVFLTYRDPSGGYSIVYPEGWAKKGSGNSTTFQDKDNVIQVVVGRGPQPTVASVKTGVEKLKASIPALAVSSAQTLTIGGQPVVKVSYSSESKPNPVTGKRVKLIVDRYAYFKGGRVAIVDLGTAVGVDNVDAYKMIARSFKWQ